MLHAAAATAAAAWAAAEGTGAEGKKVWLLKNPVLSCCPGFFRIDIVLVTNEAYLVNAIRGQYQ